MVSTRAGAKSSTGAGTPSAPAKRAPEAAPSGESKRAAKKPAVLSEVKAAAPTSKGDTTFQVGKAVTKDVTLVNQDEKEVKFSDLYKDQGVVIFMYPKANTPGCTKQACGFRDHIQGIKDVGYKVYGLSADRSKALLNWKTKQNLAFDLLSDPNHELIKYFGSSLPGSKIQRSHVVILKGGVVGEISGKVSPAESIDNAVAFVNAHKQNGQTAASPAQTKTTSSTVIFEVGKKTTFDMTLQTEESKSVTLQSLFKDQGVVFFMFPKADTPGCTIQACGFNDHIDTIKSAGFQVFGLSGDTPAELLAWKEKKNYAYSFLSDPKHELIQYFGCSQNGGKSVERAHVIILKGGEVGEIQHKISPKDSFTKALAFVQSHTSPAKM